MSAVPSNPHPPTRHPSGPEPSGADAFVSEAPGSEGSGPEPSGPPVVRSRPFSDFRTPAEIAARHREIDEVADRLRRAHWDQATLPVCARDLAEGAGVEVRARGGPDEPMYPYRGRLLMLDDRPVIELNLAVEPMRRRLVLAHALGHHLLDHGPVPPETLPTLSMQHPRRIEQEANHFALELLMPDFALYRLMNHGMVSARKLAQKFFVPEAAIHARLQTLETKCGYL
ncbi:ImmA/IrrE family metallo-endopeptidase [Mitsuaria sp. GD03876]|uniref:ImmA/IrrE family metallo-endopeptidase n=1 Tax=Mitsuaria sp. GD03876 TaxID=2975399 RepID=UPI002449C958|nr:ImmA/IrrE family metallo-endopeptidase [Mitsuaria sp. GD03876]MDH0865690.1 ImmA/IrrE family metallo-endopeptidase [Mitsuaria sp. GD03876]